jgi:hypothetical protein
MIHDNFSSSTNVEDDLAPGMATFTCAVRYFRFVERVCPGNSRTYMAAVDQGRDLSELSRIGLDKDVGAELV